MSVRAATDRYLAARKEFLAAAENLRATLSEDARRVMTKATVKVVKRRTWKEAAEMARRVRSFVAAHPSWTQAEVADHLIISREMVAHYLYSPKHRPDAAKGESKT